MDNYVGFPFSKKPSSHNPSHQRHTGLQSPEKSLPKCPSKPGISGPLFPAVLLLATDQKPLVLANTTVFIENLWAVHLPFRAHKAASGLVYWQKCSA